MTPSLKKTLRASCAGLFLLAIAVAASLLVGGHSLGSLAALLWGEGDSAASRSILFSYRIPRTLMASIAGGGLATAGVVFQAALRNPLADPYLTGVAGGGALGAVLSIVLLGEARPLGTPGIAFLGSLVAVLIVHALARRTGTGNTVDTVILAGAVVSAMMSALMILLMAVGGSDELQRAVFWLMGDVSSADIGKSTGIGIAVGIGWLILFLNANRLNVLLSGEDAATSLGLPVRRLRTLVLAVGAFITAAIVSVAGTIGFVGLVVPHAVRKIVGPDHRVLLPACWFAGAAFLTVADCAARTVAYPLELPVGVITALTGGPFFLYLLLRRG